MRNENEIRFYLGKIKESMNTIDEETGKPVFTPQVLVTAVQLPTGAIEIITNTSEIESKIDNVLEAYDHNMRLKTNQDIMISNIMVV